MRRLDRPRRKGAVGKESGMGIGHHRADRNAVGQGRQPFRRRKRPCRRDDARHGGEGHVENRQQLLVPAPADNVEKLRAGGVTGFDHRLAAEARQDERVDCPDAGLRRLGAGLPRWEAVEEPARLGGGEHGIERQPALSSNDAAVPGRAQGGADVLRPLVLPRQNGRQRFAAPTVPDDAGFALRAQADRDDAFRSRRIERVGHGAAHARPNLVRVLLDPPWLRRR